MIEVGDMVTVKQHYPDDWREAQDQPGIVIGFGKRLHVPAVKILVLGEIAEFDLDEVEYLREHKYD